MAQSEIALRNRAIKTTLESAFGRGKVTVRGSRGTAYGYVYASIDWTPLDMDQSNRMESECKALLYAAKIDLGKAYTDDTCQWECDQCRIEFNPPRFYRAKRHSDGTMSVMRDHWDGQWETIDAAAA